jgi:DNA-binding transcriptional ArsR family regulator
MTAPCQGEQELREIDEVFRALAHPTRRHVLLVIRARGGEMGAGQIAARFSCSWPTTTRHLRVLQDAGLVVVERRGRERVYSVAEEKLRRVVGGWVKWFEEEKR